MTRGIVIIAFNQYKSFAYHCLKISRDKTDLPITVCINEPTREERIEGISNAYWKVYPKNTNDRLVKLSMYDESPYDETIFMDADSIIQNPGIERMFDMLKHSDIVLNEFDVWEDRVISLYRTAFKKFGVSGPPFRIYNGALWAFKKNTDTQFFFNRWRNYWEKTGECRDMPALACAVRNSSITPGHLPAGFYAPDAQQSTAVVQHYYTGFEKYFKLPFNKIVSPTGQDSSSDWTWVNM